MRIAFELLACCFLTASAALPTLATRDAPFDQVRTRQSRTHNNLDQKEPDKYFHEATFSRHYDGRFGARQVSYDERRAHLSALVQTYLSSMNDIGAETWIMHGTLLGWWWNRKILPWDSDIDVMVSEKTIHHLADYYNMTIHHYHLPGMDQARDYLLEINPHYANSSSREKPNVIDARWIDTETGLYIDITTLRRNTTAEALGQDGAMMVKDTHQYMYDDIFPLRESTFENIAVKVPYAYSDVLVEEYHERALSDLYFEGHRFDEEKKEWVKQTYVNSHGRPVHGRPRLPFSNWGKRPPVVSGH